MFFLGRAIIHQKNIEDRSTAARSRPFYSRAWYGPHSRPCRVKSANPDLEFLRRWHYFSVFESQM